MIQKNKQKTAMRNDNIRYALSSILCGRAGYFSMHADLEEKSVKKLARVRGPEGKPYLHPGPFPNRLGFIF